MVESLKLEPTFIFGYSSSVRGGALFIDDNNVVFTVGHVLTFHAIKENTQNYVKVKGTFKINAVTISPNRKVVAVAMIGSKPVISFYDTKTLMRLMTVGNPTEDFKARVFEHLAFTQDNVYLIAVTNEPEGLLILYKWETGGVVAHTKADGKTGNVSTPITVIAPHPQDTSIIALGGIGVFRLIALYYNEWRQFGFKRAEYWPISGICWITSELVLVSTLDGRLMVIEESLVKGEYRVEDLVELRVSAKDDSRKHNVVEAGKQRQKQSDTGFSVRGLTAFPRGFAFAYRSGEVCVFQKASKRHWVKKNVIMTGAPFLWEGHLQTVNVVIHINVSPSGDSILATSSSNEIYFGSIFHEQGSKFETNLWFEKLHNGYHFGPVVAVSACLYKPLFLTAGSSDRTCFIWNLETLRLVNSKVFAEDIVTAVFHPSGWYCAVSFDKNLQILMVLLEGMKTIATLKVKGSRLMCYSKQGHNLACVNGTYVEIYATTTFDKIWEIPAPGAISSLLFSANDFVLFIGGLDGVVFKYCLKSGRELLHLETESGVVHGMAAAADGEILYVVGADGCLKVYRTDSSFFTKATKMALSYPLGNSVLTSIALACEDTVLLVGAQTASLLSLQTPIIENRTNVSSFKLHSSAIVKMEITHVHPTVLSLGRDGVVGVWKLRNLSRKASFLRYYREADEAIVNAENWSNKRAIIKEQQEAMSKMDRGYDEKVREIEMEKIEEEGKVVDRYQGVLDIINLNNKITKEKNAAEVDKMRYQNRQLVSNFEQELNEQRANFENRLQNEQVQFEKLKVGWDNVKSGFDQLIKSIKMAGQCVSKRLEYFTSLELMRQANEAFLMRDEVVRIIEEQKNRELNLLKHSQLEIDELVENAERHEKVAIEIIELRGQKQKLLEQVEALESVYFNAQEFLREAHKTAAALDKGNLSATASKSTKKIHEKLKGIKESGEDIVGNLEISKMFKLQHMVSEESIESLCQLNCLMEEQKAYKRKEFWMTTELMNSTRTLTKLKYILSFLSLQNALHNNALWKSVSREKFLKRKVLYLGTNLKKEIHSMLCGLDSGNLKARLISLMAQYADTNLESILGLEKSAGKEFWKALTHLEATQLHFGNCLQRMKAAKQPRTCSRMESYVEKYDDDVDESEFGGSEESQKSLRFTADGVGREVVVDEENASIAKSLSTKSEGNEEASSSDFYDTSSSESSTSCSCFPPEDDVLLRKQSKIQDEFATARMKTPMPLLIKTCSTEKRREDIFSQLMEEKKLMTKRLNDLKKRLGGRMKKKLPRLAGNSLERSERTTYRSSYYKTPMNAIVEALNKEINYLSNSQECKDIAEYLVAKKMRAELSDESVPNAVHLCSLCKGYESFAKYFEKAACKTSVCGMSNHSKQGDLQRASKQTS